MGVGGGEEVRGRGQGTFYPPCHYCTTTWCFALKGLRTTREPCVLNTPKSKKEQRKKPACFPTSRSGCLVGGAKFVRKQEIFSFRQRFNIKSREMSQFGGVLLAFRTQLHCDVVMQKRKAQRSQCGPSLKTQRSKDTQPQKVRSHRTSD